MSKSSASRGYHEINLSHATLWRTVSVKYPVFTCEQPHMDSKIDLKCLILAYSQINLFLKDFKCLANVAHFTSIPHLVSLAGTV